jgi:hypothetical protein
MDYEEQGKKILETPQNRRDFLRGSIRAGGAIVGAIPLVGLAGKALASTRTLTDEDVKNIHYSFRNETGKYGEFTRAIPFLKLNPEYDSWKYERTQVDFPLNGLHIPTSLGMVHTVSDPNQPNINNLDVTGSNFSGGDQLLYPECFHLLFAMMGHRSMRLFDTEKDKADGLTHEGQFLPSGVGIDMYLGNPHNGGVLLKGFKADQEVREKFSRITNYHAQQEGEPLYNWMYDFLKTAEEAGGDAGGSTGGEGGGASGGGEGDGGSG